MDVPCRHLPASTFDDPTSKKKNETKIIKNNNDNKNNNNRNQWAIMEQATCAPPVAGQAQINGLGEGDQWHPFYGPDRIQFKP